MFYFKRMGLAIVHPNKTSGALVCAIPAAGRLLEL